jgi:hypothetical protein
MKLLLWISIVLFSAVIVAAVIKWPVILLVLILLTANYFLLKKLGVVK